MKTRVILLALSTLTAAACGKSSSAACGDGPGCTGQLIGINSVLVSPSSGTVKVGEASVENCATVAVTP